MGNSVLCQSDRDRNRKSSYHKFLNDYADKINQSDLPMEFLINLKRVKGVKLKEQDLYLDIDVFGSLKHRTVTIYNTSNPRWIIKKKVHIVVNKVEDLGRILNIKIYSKKGKYLGNVEMTFFDALIGTVKNSFVINSRNKYIGRLQFDIKVSQIIKMKILVEKIKAQFFDFENKFSVKNFNQFSFSVYLDIDTNVNSINRPFHQFSKNSKTALTQNIQETINDYEFRWESSGFNESNYDIVYSEVEPNDIVEELLTIDRKNSIKILSISTSDESDSKNLIKKDIKTFIEKKKILEDLELNELEDENKKEIHHTKGRREILPNADKIPVSLTFTLRTTKFPFTHLVFKFYETNALCNGLAYLPLDNFFFHQGNFIGKDDKRYVTTNINIWKFGHFVGNLELYLKFDYSTFFRQSKAGIRTEDGIFCSTNILSYNDSKKFKDSKAIQLLKNYKGEFTEVIFGAYRALENHSSVNTLDDFDIVKRFYEDVMENFGESAKILCKDDEMLKFQQSLIEL